MTQYTRHKTAHDHSAAAITSIFQGFLGEESQETLIGGHQTGRNLEPVMLAKVLSDR
jgi:hypothetical protein